MTPIDRYRLARHDGPYERWPLTTPLFADDRPTGQRVPGYVIDAQYRCAAGALLVTSFDCLFEESNAFLLLDAAHRCIAKRELQTPYATWLLHAHWPQDASTIVLHYQTAIFMRLQVLPPAWWWPRRPRLRVSRCPGWRSDPRMVDSHRRLQDQLARIGTDAALTGVDDIPSALTDSTRKEH